MQSNGLLFNIYNKDTTAVMPYRNKENNKNIAKQGDIISAHITNKTSEKISLETKQGFAFEVKYGEIKGEIGDEAYFEVVQKNSEGMVLKQVFPEEAKTGREMAKQASIKELKELMQKNDFIDTEDNNLKPKSLKEQEAEIHQKAMTAVSKIKRSISKISSNASHAAMAELVASGVNLDKISISVLSAVTNEIAASPEVDRQKVLDELNKKLDGIMNLSENEMMSVIKSGKPLTLENIYVAKFKSNSRQKGAEQALSDADWEKLKPEVAKILEREGVKPTEDHFADAKQLIENEIPVTKENMDKLVFLSDIEGNIDREKILEDAVENVQNGESVSEVAVFRPQGNTKNAEEALHNVSSKRQTAEMRLKMSREARDRLLHKDIEIDLAPQERGLEELRAHEKALMARALRQNDVPDTEENNAVMLDIFDKVKSLASATYKTYEAVNSKKITFNLTEMHNYIAAEKYEASATVASLKYGDTFSKVSEQFAPLLQAMGIVATEQNIRAAKILSMNRMDLNEENILNIKTIDAKISSVSSKLHPMIAAKMIQEGLNPAEMHVDEVLQYVDKWKGDYGTNDNDQLYQNIMEMDRTADIPQEVRETMISVYRMLDKITRNNGAGIGAAVNANSDLTLQGLMDFSKIYSATRGNRSSINYSVDDKHYYAKNLVSSFISAASPKPLAAFVKKEDLNDPLEESVLKIQELKESLEKENIETINKEQIEAAAQKIRQLQDTPAKMIRFMQDSGIALTLPNIQMFKNFMGDSNYLKSKLDELKDDEVSEIEDSIQDSDLQLLQNGETPSEVLEEMITKLAGVQDNAHSTEKITRIDQTIRALQFRNLLSQNTVNHSFPIKLNGNLTDINMYMINDNLNIGGEVNIFMSLKTQLGEIQAFIKTDQNQAELALATENVSASNYLKNNVDYLVSLTQELGIKLTKINISQSEPENSVEQMINAVNSANPAIKAYDHKKG